MISSWYTYWARRMDMRMRCQDTQIMIKEKMTTSNLWYYHPSSLVKYLPASREVKKQTQVTKKNGCAIGMGLIQGTFNRCKKQLKGINRKTKRAKKSSRNGQTP